MSLAHPAVAYRVDEDGHVPGGIWVLPELTCELPGIGVGYFQRSMYDCVRAAVATVTQIPYEGAAIPDGAEVGRGVPAGLLPFLGEHCLGFSYHPTLSDVPADVLAVALTPPLPEAGGDCHTYVTRGPEIVFDPWAFVRTDGSPAVPGGASLPPAYAYSFTPEPT